FRAGHLLIEDHHLDDGGAPPPELAWPVQADVAGLGHRLLPGPEPRDLVAVGARRREGAAAEIVGQIGLEPRADFRAKRFLLRREIEVHGLVKSSPRRRRATPPR